MNEVIHKSSLSFSPSPLKKKKRRGDGKDINPHQETSTGGWRGEEMEMRMRPELISLFNCQKMNIEG